MREPELEADLVAKLEDLAGLVGFAAEPDVVGVLILKFPARDWLNRGRREMNCRRKMRSDTRKSNGYDCE